MSTQDIGLFKALSARMDYLNQRQGLLSQNIANADTPGYRPYDLKPMDFRSVLRKADGGSVAAEPVRTNPLHMTTYGSVLTPEETEERSPYDVEPTGNAVSLEEQMVKSSQNQVDYSMITSLYQKNVNMIRTALGRP